MLNYQAQSFSRIQKVTVVQPHRNWKYNYTKGENSKILCIMNEINHLSKQPQRLNMNVYLKMFVDTQVSSRAELRSRIKQSKNQRLWVQTDTLCYHDGYKVIRTCCYLCGHGKQTSGHYEVEVGGILFVFFRQDIFFQ